MRTQGGASTRTQSACRSRRLDRGCAWHGSILAHGNVQTLQTCPRILVEISHRRPSGQAVVTSGERPVGHYVVCWLSVSGNSRSVAAMALTAAGSSVQCRAVRVQAWKFVTFDALAASVSSAHASRSSVWSSGDMGAPGTRSAATTGVMGAAVAPLRRKRLLRPISVPPFPSAQSINVPPMRPGHCDRAPSPRSRG